MSCSIFTSRIIRQFCLPFTLFRTVETLVRNFSYVDFFVITVFTKCCECRFQTEMISESKKLSYQKCFETHFNHLFLIFSFYQKIFEQCFFLILSLFIFIFKRIRSPQICLTLCVDLDKWSRLIINFDVDLMEKDLVSIVRGVKHL